MTEHFQYILHKAQQYCSYQERSLYEVKTKLDEWSTQPSVVEKIIEELRQENYLNEEQFAKSYATGKFRQKKWGKNKIIYELRKKQIPDLYIQIGLSEIDDEEYEETLKNLISKKLKESREKNPRKRNYKVAYYAISKGFRSGLVWEKINELKDSS